MIRPTRPDDIPAIVELGMEALNTKPYPSLVISRERVEEMALLCVSSAQHFAWVSEVDGEVVGSVGGYVSDMTFYERKQCAIVQFYAPGAPWEWVKLIRECLNWCRRRPLIKLVTFTLEPDADPRIGKVLTKMGLHQELMYVELT